MSFKIDDRYVEPYYNLIKLFLAPVKVMYSDGTFMDSYSPGETSYVLGWFTMDGYNKEGDSTEFFRLTTTYLTQKVHSFTKLRYDNDGIVQSVVHKDLKEELIISNHDNTESTILPSLYYSSDLNVGDAFSWNIPSLNNYYYVDLFPANSKISLTITGQISQYNYFENSVIPGYAINMTEYPTKFDQSKYLDILFRPTDLVDIHGDSSNVFDTLVKYQSNFGDDAFDIEKDVKIENGKYIEKYYDFHRDATIVATYDYQMGYLISLEMDGETIIEMELPEVSTNSSESSLVFISVMIPVFVMISAYSIRRKLDQII